MVARGPKGERTIPIGQFFKGLFSTALAADEILTEIRIPAPAARSGGAYVKFERKVGDFAIAAAAALVTLDAKGAIERAGVGLTNAGPAPIEAVDAARFLTGKMPDEAVDRRGRPAGRCRHLAQRRPPRLGAVQAGNGPRHGDARTAQGDPTSGRALTMAKHRIQVTVNGTAHEAEVESRLLLVHLIREVFRLTGTHIGCDTSHCGACTVLLDGEPVKSCTVLAVQADGGQIRTVEGLEQGGKLHPSKRASPRSTACNAATARRAC